MIASYNCVLQYFRFLNDEGKSFSASLKTEPVSVDSTVGRTYQCRQQLHLASNEGESQDIPPPLPAEHKAGNCTENSLTNSSTLQDNPTIHDQLHLDGFRPRTQRISSEQAERYKKLKRDNSKNNTSTITLPQHDHNPNKTPDVSNHDDKPPPLPPKHNGISCPSVYQHNTYCESLFKEKPSTQSSQYCRKQGRLVNCSVDL